MIVHLSQIHIANDPLAVNVEIYFNIVSGERLVTRELVRAATTSQVDAIVATELHALLVELSYKEVPNLPTMDGEYLLKVGYLIQMCPRPDSLAHSFTYEIVGAGCSKLS